MSPCGLSSCAVVGQHTLDIIPRDNSPKPRRRHLANSKHLAYIAAKANELNANSRTFLDRLASTIHELWRGSLLNILHIGRQVQFRDKYREWTSFAEDSLLLDVGDRAVDLPQMSVAPLISVFKLTVSPLNGFHRIAR